MTSQEPSIFDLAYQGKVLAVKTLVAENEKLNTQTDSVRIRTMEKQIGKLTFSKVIN